MAYTIGNVRTKKHVKAVRKGQRKNKAGFGENPSTLSKIIVSKKLGQTYDGKKFYWDDSGPEDLNRVILFTTTENLAELSKHHDWYGDGTFDIAPTLFLQLYSIHIIRNGKDLPMAYAFLPNKLLSTYIVLFEMIMSCVSHPPISFNFDFEKSVFNAVKLVFGEHVLVNMGVIFISLKILLKILPS